MKEFAERLKEVQTKRGLSQAQLATLIGVTPGTVSAYLNDQKNPTIETVKGIAAALGVSIGWLCGEADTSTFRNRRINYGQLLRVLHELIDTEFIPGFTMKSGGNDTVRFWLESEDPVVNRFWGAVQKARKLYETGSLDREMYDAIIDKHIENVSDVLIPTKGMF